MTEPNLDHDSVVPFLADIFHRRGADSYLGEAVTMSEHMLQAAWLAQQSGASDELIAAALLHDIGHYTSEFGEASFDHGIDNHHDEAGGRVLAAFFPPVITECVRLHVAAKRYLCATDAEYSGRLSPASVHTLSLQGGPMSPSEVAEFERNPYAQEAVRVRIWDDEAKTPGRDVPGFDSYAELLRGVVSRHHALPARAGATAG